MPDGRRENVLLHAILAVGAAVTIGCMFHAGEPGSPWWWFLFLPFAAWGLLPYGGVASTAKKLSGSPGPQRAVLAGAASVSAVGLAALYATFAGPPDAQAGLVFVFLPVWQGIVFLPFWALARFFERRSVAG